MQYAELTDELEELLRELEEDDVPVDELAKKVQRCYALIRQGRQKLRAVEDAVEQVLAEFEEEDDDVAPAPAPPAEKPAKKGSRRKSLPDAPESADELPF